MKISIVTLNYNGSKETLELLKSLKEQTDTDFEIIVIDNASEEADFTALQTGINQLIHRPTSQVGYPQEGTVLYPPQVKVVRNSKNLGFSGGNNVGIRHALTPTQRISKDTDKQSLSRCESVALQNDSDWVVLLNNDTWGEKDFIERLRAILSVKKGVVGIPLIEGDPAAPILSADRHSERRRDWGGASRVAYCGKVQWLKPTLIHMTDIASRLSTGPTCDVGYEQVYAIGGAMAVHKSVFDKVGLLDEKYFLYFEDADFSVRAKKAGFGISVAENLSAHHHVSVSAKKLGSPLLMRYHYRNALYFNLKNGPRYIKFLVWPWSWIIVIKQLGKLVISRNREESKAILEGVKDFYKNKMGEIKTG